MKFKFIINALMAMVAILLFSSGIVFATGFNPFIVVSVITALSFLPSGTKGAAYEGLSREIWLPELMEGFYSNTTFNTEARDFSAFVENNKIHLAEAGVNPKVLKNNTTYPVPIAERTDTPLELALNVYDTENTLLRNAEKAELSYDKRASVLYGHRMALQMFAMQEAAQNYAPNTHTDNTPVLTASGADNGKGVKRLTFEDLLKLETAFNEAEIGSEGRILVINTKHLSDLQAQDIKLYKQILTDKMLFGFKMYSLASKRMPRYNRTNGKKVAFGAAAIATDTICSLAFHKDEVMRADGTLDMFSKEKDPELRGDLLGFQKRGLYLPIRNKGLASIYSPTV